MIDNGNTHMGNGSRLLSNSVVGHYDWIMWNYCIALNCIITQGQLRMLCESGGRGDAWVVGSQVKVTVVAFFFKEISGFLWRRGEG